jgi:hypothetical protein
MIRPRPIALALLLLTAVASPGFTQEPAQAPAPEPIGLFVADVRAAFPRFKADASVADALGVGALDLPTQGLGLVFGAHVYPARFGAVTLGVGAEVIRSGRSRTRAANNEGVAGPTVQTSFSAFSPQLSLNFGSKDGWSYLSGGLGWGSFGTELETAPLPDAEGRLQVINYGGGARWFVKPRVALSLDLRFYAVNPQEATVARPAFPRKTMIVMSAGVGIK